MVAFRDWAAGLPPVVLASMAIVILASIAGLITNTQVILDWYHAHPGRAAALERQLGILETGVQADQYSELLGVSPSTRTRVGSFEMLDYELDLCAVMLIVNGDGQVAGYAVTTTDPDFRPELPVPGGESKVTLGVTSPAEVFETPGSFGGIFGARDSYYAEATWVIAAPYRTGYVLLGVNDAGAVTDEQQEKLNASRDYWNAAEENREETSSTALREFRGLLAVNTIGFADDSLLPSPNYIRATTGSLLDSDGLILGEFRVGIGRYPAASRDASRIDANLLLTTLAAEVQESYFTEKLGAPAISNTIPPYRENIYLDRFYFVQTVSDESERVVMYSVTSRDTSFNPPLPYDPGSSSGSQSAQVRLCDSTFADISNAPGMAVGFSGAHDLLYGEVYYLAGPGQYQTLVVASNDAGADPFDWDNYPYSFDWAEIDPLLWGVVDTSNPVIQTFREEQYINTYSVFAPFFDYESIGASDSPFPFRIRFGPTQYDVRPLLDE